MPRLALVVPAFNEAQRLGGTLDAVAAYLAETGIDAHVIVVDDGSTDATADVAVRHAVSDRPVDVISLPGQRGKGAAVRAGMLAADADVIGFVDADLSTPLDELPQVLGGLRPRIRRRHRFARDPSQSPPPPAVPSPAGRRADVPGARATHWRVAGIPG